LFKDKYNVGYVLKADVRHYFDTVDHQIVINIVRRKIKDEKVIWLLKTILNNHETEIPGKGMPIGNLTSQFLANVYLNELDNFVKHTLKVKYYIRYVDDFVIFHKDKTVLEKWRMEIDVFLKNILKVELHPEKTRIVKLNRGVTFLGFRIFYNCRLLKKNNVRRIWKRIKILKEIYAEGKLTREEADNKIEGWFAYARFANTYALRRRVLKRYSKIFI
jgi:RNA-directed DNA polymerase